MRLKESTIHQKLQQRTSGNRKRLWTGVVCSAAVIAAVLYNMCTS